MSIACVRREYYVQLPAQLGINDEAVDPGSYTLYAMNETSKSILKFLAIAICGCLVLSLFFHIPFIYTFCGFSAWMTFGHLITIDDDAPGGFSNPGENKLIWRHSLLELVVKFVLLIFLCALAFAVPVIRSYGA